jgi:hypothetical protein
MQKINHGTNPSHLLDRSPVNMFYKKEKKRKRNQHLTNKAICANLKTFLAFHQCGTSSPNIAPSLFTWEIL